MYMGINNQNTIQFLLFHAFWHPADKLALRKNLKNLHAKSQLSS